MKRKRAVLVGVMSEICMKGRIVLDQVRSGLLPSAEEADRKLKALEAEMEQCVKKIGRMLH